MTRHKPEGSEKLYVVPCSKEKAGEFITYQHRHHTPLDFASYCLAVCTSDGRVHGVCLIGRTATQHFDGPNNHWAMEVRRVATDGTKNACSILYAAAWHLVSAMGYRKLISYTLPEEGGSSLRALGWRRVDNVGGNSWAHRNKSGVDIHPVGKKTRWEVEVAPEKVQPFDTIEWPVYDSVQKNMFEQPTLVNQGVGAMLKEVGFNQVGFTEQAELFEQPFKPVYK